ncbi:glycosyltransferase, partial [Streptomyces sp. P9(2023)]|uniref:glycosyltransferase n=1 Tax=Streptomyces sp. P9(2023) TaxID=3064394 RepID=UPI0028F41A15
MYIEDAIVGFLLQETSFPFEVIIHDDASLDNTAVIIAEYSDKYPNIIKPILQEENQFSRLGMQMTIDLLNNCS